MNERIWPNRSKAAIAVLLLHGAIGYLLISELAYHYVCKCAEPLRVYFVENVPASPPPAPEPAPRNMPRPSGAASPTSLAANATPVVAPSPVVPVPAKPILPTTPEPTPVPQGSDPDAGSSTLAGPGTGAGGAGIGTGSDGQGDGTGGGSRRAQRIGGAIMNSDYPRSALRMGIEGIVKVRYTISPEGRATRCTIVETSGFFDLDQTTCRLIERRFRYLPALDGNGRPVPQVQTNDFSWRVLGRGDRPSLPR